MSAFHFVLAVVFLVVVVPTWMHYHYGRRGRGAGVIQPSVDAAELNALRELAAKLEERVRTLERVLDAEAPEWRSKV